MACNQSEQVQRVVELLLKDSMSFGVEKEKNKSRKEAKGVQLQRVLHHCGENDSALPGLKTLTFTAVSDPTTIPDPQVSKTIRFPC